MPFVLARAVRVARCSDLMKKNLAIVPRREAPDSADPTAGLELELYRRIFTSARDAIAIIDADGYYLQQNRAHEHLLGYSDHEIRGQTPALHFGEAGFAAIAEELARSGCFHGELPTRTRQGKEIVVELSAFTMRDAAGKVLCHVGVTRDVTKRWRADNELNARLRQQATVARLGQQALAAAEIDALFRDTVHSIAQLLGVEYCKVLELMPDGQQFLLRAGVGWNKELLGRATVSADPQSQAGYTLSCSSPVVVEDFRRETRFRGTSLLQSEPIASSVSVLIPVHGRPWGVLAAHSSRPRKFTEHDVNFLQALANTLAVAIERQQDERALQESQQRLSLAQRGSNAAIWDWDLLTGVVSWARDSCELYGVPMLTVNSLAVWLERVHPDDRQALTEQIAEAVRQEREFDAEFRSVWPDGSIHWIAARGQVFYARGTPVRMVGLSMDVTERKRASEALRQSEERFRRAQRAANIAAYEWNLDTGEVTWSEQLPVLEGIVSDTRFDSWMQRVRADARESLQRSLQEMLTTGADLDVEVPLVRDDGSVVWVVSRGQVMREAGRPRLVSGILVDVTARKQAEELMQRSEKLAMIGRLAASIAHEINNPLESVTNLLYLIENHASLDDDARGYAQLASQELGRVSHISRQTLGFYRESSNPTPVNVAELVSDILRLYGRKLEQKSIEVRQRYRVSRKLSLHAADLSQVFGNLLMNAVEACCPGGTLHVRLQRGRDWRNPGVRGVRLVVADNGHGVPPELCGRIFEPFFTTKGEKGTGLGLWVCNGLVQKHGGSIRLRTRTDPQRHGTVFVVFLPEVGIAKPADKSA